MEKEKLFGLDFVRAMACLMIVLHHSNLKTNDILGRYAVTIFILLSGYLVGFLKKDKTEYSIKDSFICIKEKIGKFYGLYFLSFVLGLVLIFEGYMVNGNFDAVGGIKVLIAKIILYLTMLQSWIPSGDFYLAINGVAWYMSVIMFCYFLQPFYEFLHLFISSVRICVFTSDKQIFFSFI